MTGDAGKVTHDPSHAYIMKEAVAGHLSGDEGDKYCNFQSWDNTYASGKEARELIKVNVKCHIPSVSVLGNMSDFDLYLLHESLNFVYA